MTQRIASGSVNWKKSARWFDGRGYHLGMWAFILNRLTGLLLVAYIFVHFMIISMLYQGEAAWDTLMGLFQSPFALAFDIALMIALLLHGLNGVRVVVLAFNVGVRYQKTIFWGLMAGGILLLGLAAFRLVTH